MPNNPSSATHTLDLDDSDHISKKSRTGDVVLDKDPPSPTGVNAVDYSHGVLKPMCSPFFDELRQQLGPYLVDKTQLIEKIISNGLNGNVHLVLRPRRCGKTTMLLMLKSFFCIPQSDDLPLRQLFDGLDIVKHVDLCNKHMGKYAVLFLDFKNIVGDSWANIFLSFRTLVSMLYSDWRGYVWDSLFPEDQQYFESICANKAPQEDWTDSLFKLCRFLAQKSKRQVMVFIDEYEAPNNRSYGQDFFNTASTFFGRDVLPPLLKTNPYVGYAILAGVTPTTKAGWDSGLNNVEVHALHTKRSIFAGMLMFTEEEVTALRTLSHSTLDPADFKAHYGSCLAAGVISVYNPVSIVSAFTRGSIENFWVATGECPLLHKTIPDDISALEIVQTLLTGSEVKIDLWDNINLSVSTLSLVETLTLLYYAGYLTMTPSGNLKIPNREVMANWARWITGAVEDITSVLDLCVLGPVDMFAEQWPSFMQQSLHPKAVSKAQSAIGSKTGEHIYQVFFLGLMYNFQSKGWNVEIEPRGGSDFIDILLVSTRTQNAVLIELKSSDKRKDIKKDSQKALDQIEDKKYRNSSRLLGIRYLREYGIANYHLESCVTARYLELVGQNQWVKKADPTRRTQS